MLFLSEADVTSVLTMSDTIEAIEQALRAQAEGEARFPLRTMAAAPDGLLAAMSGVVGGERRGLATKLVSVFPKNAARQLHTHQAVIVVFDYATGEPRALMDGRYITEIRTAAVSGLATRALAASGSNVAAIIGTGVQARAHAQALQLVMPLHELRIWGRTREHAESLATTVRDQGVKARVADDVKDACRGAHVICTVTASLEPVLNASHVDAGAHINGVGASVPKARELAGDLMARASIFVDSLDGARTEAGDIILAIAEGALPAQPKLTLLADVIAGRASGRTSKDEITVFESLGIAIEDVACATLVYERAKQRGLGTQAAL